MALENAEKNIAAPKARKSTARFILEIVEIVIIAIALSWVIRTFVIEARFIPSGSMLPTIQLGDKIMVDKFFYKTFGSVSYGDLIVFHPPESVHSADDFIKRVIGLPGDTIEIQGHQLFRNGTAVEEPYVAERMMGSYGPITVPEDSLFVLGDNRNASDDSRIWGFLPMENVAGKALFRYWPLSSFGAIK